MAVLPEKAQLVSARARAFVRSPYALILAIYVALRVIAAVGISVMRHPDSNSWTWLDFSGSDVRLWTVPLFFKVLPNDALREAGQVALSIVCWVGLAGVTARAIASRNLKLIAFGTVLIVSLTVDVTMWDTTILGESVAISLTVGAIAAWWMFVMRPTWATAGLVCVTVVLWAFLRHTNLVVTGLIALIIGLSLLVRHARLLRVVVLGAIVITLLWGVPTVGKNSFNEDEILLTVISERVLTSPERTDWFAKHGMPANEDVRALAGAFDQQGRGSVPFRQNKKLFRWVHEHGRSTYFEFLRSHPGFLLVVPLKDAIDPDAAVLDVTHAVGTHAYGFPRSVLPEPIEGVLFGPGALSLLTVGVVALAIAAFGVRRWTRRETVPGIALALSLVLYWVTYHGVASELGRHYMLAAVSIRVSLILIGLLALDRLLSQARTRREAQSEGDS